MMKETRTHASFDPANMQSAEDFPATVGELKSVVTLVDIFRAGLEEIRREHEALKRICYLLVNNVEDEALREEMHSTYLLLATRSDTPIKEGFEDMPGDDVRD